jgi:excinuclease UvrABC nuclease subunit
MMMTLPSPEAIEVTSDFRELDASLQTTPDRPAVFLIWPRLGAPYLARTSLLRRRLQRLLQERPQPSRWLNLRPVAARIEYWLVGSRLESNLLFYQLAKRHFPDTYLKLLKLRLPPYLKVVLSNPLPRTQITTRLGGTRAFYYGPFRTRAAAEQFESQALDLFQVRRCQEELAPSPAHPGCIYGEMNMCLRPCQQAVSGPEYQSEVSRLIEFLSTRGRSLLETIASARDRLSEEMNFEEAARQHKRLEKVQQVLRLRDDLAEDVTRLCGVAVTASGTPAAVELWFFCLGAWQPPLRVSFEVVEGKTVSLDQRLREAVASLHPQQPSRIERQEHLALLARWYYSSWRDGEWLAFEKPEALPYRKLVNAIHRVGA